MSKSRGFGRPVDKQGQKGDQHLLREALDIALANSQAGLFEDTACVAALASFLERVVADRESLEPRGGGALVLA